MKKFILLSIIAACALNIHAQPVITITANGSTNTPITVCNAVTLVASGCTACISYQWKLNGANAGSNSSNYYTTQPGTYTCVATNASGTSTSNAIMVNVTVSTVSISAGGPVTFCNNPQQVTLTATNGGGYTYQWYKYTGGYSAISGATLQTYQPPVNIADKYSVRATKQGCVSISNEITVSYFTAPPSPQPLTLDNNQTWICPSGFYPIIYLASVTGCTYQWKLNGNPVNTNCSGGSQCIGPQTPGTYSCDITNACGTVSSSNTVNITQPPLPVMAVTSGSPTACTGTVQLSITNSALLPPGTTYQWKKNGTPITNQIYSGYTASNAGTYTCDVKIPECNTTTPAAVTVYTIPNVMTADPAIFCTGGATLIASPVGSTYQWKKNAVNISGATSHTYYATSTGGYSCVITPPGCTSATSNSLSITSGVTNPQITAPGGYDDCNGGTITLAVTNANGTAYQWGSQNTGDIPGETSSSFNAAQTDDYYCRVTESCGTSTVNVPGTVRILPDWYLSITSSEYPGDVCGSAFLWVQPYNHPLPYSFQWYKDGTAISGETMYGYTATQAGSYSCDVAIPGCPFSYPVGYPIPQSFNISNIVTPIPSNTPISPAGTTTVCTGNSVTVSVPACTGCDYTFYQKIGSSWSWVTPTTPNTYVIPSPNYPATYYFFVRIENECGYINTAVDTIVYVQTFTASITPAGPTSFCAPGSVVLNASPSAGYTYQWYKSNVAIPGATSSSYTATQYGTHSVIVTNAGGCNASAMVLVHAYTSVPSPTITPSGPTTFCTGGNVQLYTQSSQTYQWKKNGVTITGATLYNYTATVSGSYSVVATNSCGSSASSPVTVTVQTLPSAVITAGGPTAFCSGGSVVLNAPGGANKTYQWLKDGNAVAGATSLTYTAAAAGTYKVTVTNTVNGCSKTTTAGTVVTVNPNPAATVTPQGPTTFCAGGSVVLKANAGTGLTYKWKKNNNFISGATLLNYTATTAGTYRVEVTKSNGCTKLSAGVAITVPCKLSESEGEGENKFDVKVFPNPSSGDFVFEIINAGGKDIFITVYDMIGKKISFDQFKISNIKYQISNLAPGIYTAEITCSGNPDGFPKNRDVQGQVKKVVKLIRTE